MPRDRQDSPQNLALFRVAVCATVLLFTSAGRAVALASLPAELAVQHASAAFPLAWLPIDASLARAAAAVLYAGTVLGLVGLHARPALACATLAAIYLFGIGQTVGAVEHDHHLVWFLAILAASPSADALSIDAARATARPPRRALAYGVPLWTARLLVAAIFFFPGLWKLREAGWAWIASDNLRNQMYWKWFEWPGFAPPFRVDRYPLLVRAGAFATVAFELSFPFVVLARRLRPCLAMAAFGFHMATALFMNVRFTTLWPCYVMLFDAHGALRGLAAEIFAKKVVLSAPPPLLAAVRSADALGRVVYRRAAARAVDWVALCLRHPFAPLALLAARSPRARRTTSPWPSRVVGALLLGGAVITGALGVTQGWPFACYPTFQWIAGEEIPYLAVDAVRADGSAVTLTGLPRTQKEWGVHWSLVGATHGPPDLARLEAWCRAERLPTEGAASLRFYRAYRSVVPERRDEPPLRRELLYELAL
jgi:hypothetical protein